MNKTDIHVHFSQHQHEDMSGDKNIEDDKMISFLKSQKISHAIALSFGESSYMGLADNKRAHEIYCKYPEYLSWMCNLDLNNPEKFGERLIKYQKEGAVGIGEFHINLRIDNEIIQEVFKQAQIIDMPILFHMSDKVGGGYGIVDEPGLYLLEESLVKYPNLKFIGHSQPFWCEISGDVGNDTYFRNNWVCGPVKERGRLIELLENYENLFCDLSAGSGGRAIMRDEEFGINFIKHFSDNLLFGTDSFDCKIPYPLYDWIESKVKEDKIEVETFEKISFRNAEKIFGL